MLRLRQGGVILWSYRIQIGGGPQAPRYVRSANAYTDRALATVDGRAGRRGSLEGVLVLVHLALC